MTQHDKERDSEGSELRDVGKQGDQLMKRFQLYHSLRKRPTPRRYREMEKCHHTPRVEP